MIDGYDVARGLHWREFRRFVSLVFIHFPIYAMSVYCEKVRRGCVYNLATTSRFLFSRSIDINSEIN